MEYSLSKVVSWHFYYLNCTSLRSRRFQKKAYAKGTKLGGSAKNKEQRERVRRVKEAWFLFFPPLPPSHSPHPHLSQILCSPRTCYFARLLFRLLVESSHGKGKEKTVTQAIIVLVRPWWWWKLGQILWIVLDKLFFFFIYWCCTFFLTKWYS